MLRSKHIFLAFIVVCAAGEARQLLAEEGVEAVTVPSQDVTVGFFQPGIISEVPVIEGQSVKAGDLLVRLDDSAEKPDVAQLKLQADDKIQLLAAEAQLAQKKVDLEKFKRALEHKAASEFEVEHADLDVKIAELTVELTKMRHEQDVYKYEAAKAHLERMRVLSPFDGKVETILAHKGQSVDPQMKVMRIVKIDPLWIDVPVPMAQSRNLSLGQSASVQLPEQTAATTGKIVFIAAVSDAGSETRTVRVELPNPNSRPAGEHVKVNFPAAVGAPNSSTSQPATNPASTKE